MSITEYVNRMRTLGDEMAAAGTPIDDKELVSYILAGLDLEYNLVVSAVVSRVEPILVTELYGQLLSLNCVKPFFKDRTKACSHLWPTLPRVDAAASIVTEETSMVGALEGTLVGAPVRATPAANVQHVKFVKKKGIQRSNVGTTLMKATTPTRRLYLLPLMHTTWT
jgi:hypothetical protein